MRPRRLAVTVLLVAVLSVLGVGAASAGGPTSVLLVVPGTGQTASLYTSDADYQTLARLVGAYDAGEEAAEGSGAGHEFGSGVTVTWLIHDVSVWRVDRIYATAAGGPWIATQSVLDGSESLWDQPVVWHKAARGKELTALLARLGVSQSAGGSGGVEPSAGNARDGGGAVSSAAAGTSGRDSQPAESGTAAGKGWAWGLAGLAGGVVLTLAATRVVPIARRRRGAAAEDLAWTGGLAGEPHWSAPEQLSSFGRPR